MFSLAAGLATIAKSPGPIIATFVLSGKKLVTSSSLASNISGYLTTSSAEQTYIASASREGTGNSPISTIAQVGTSRTLKLKGFVQGPGVTINVTSDEIQISSSAGAETDPIFSQYSSSFVTSSKNTGSGASIYSGSNQGNHGYQSVFKTLVAGAGIYISESAFEVLITSSATGGGSTDVSGYLLTASFTAYTASISSSIAALNIFSGSTFNSYTSSISASIAALNSLTASVNLNEIAFGSAIAGKVTSSTEFTWGVLREHFIGLNAGPSASGLFITRDDGKSAGFILASNSASITGSWRWSMFIDNNNNLGFRRYDTASGLLGTVLELWRETGNVRIGNLAGTGIRNVIVDATGSLSASDFPVSSSWASSSISSSYALSASYLIGGSSGTPGGSNTQIQFNDGGTFNGSNNFTYTSASRTVNITGSLLVSGSVQFSGSVNSYNGFTGSLAGTASRAISASWAPEQPNPGGKLYLFYNF